MTETTETTGTNRLYSCREGVPEARLLPGDPRAVALAPPNKYTWLVRLVPLWLPLLGFVSAAISTELWNQYGWVLFAVLPTCLAALAVTLHDWREDVSMARAIALALRTVLAVSLLLFVTGFEGLICILMAAPIWGFFAVLGGLIGLLLRQSVRRYVRGLPIILPLLAITPAALLLEHIARREPALFAVQTAVEIDAAPEVVWRNVISFAELPEPQDWLFRAGVAYPTCATIDGRGPGATRYCTFSTGSFEEPIETWNEPHLLRFSVTANPPPMRELSLYDVHPPHLHGFLVSKSGQFELFPLPNGRTRLEGTTHYQHGLFPESYWRFWSDQIIHRIHARVLTHIKGLSEGARIVGFEDSPCAASSLPADPVR